jgi:hypothetical protein
MLPPFDVLVSTLEFISISTKFLGRLLRLSELGIEFGLGGLMLSIKYVNRSLAFCNLFIQVLMAMSSCMRGEHCIITFDWLFRDATSCFMASTLF